MNLYTVKRAAQVLQITTARLLAFMRSGVVTASHSLFHEGPIFDETDMQLAEVAIEEWRSGVQQIVVARNADIVKRYTEEPVTLEQIAAKENITRERVRQILKEHGITAANGRRRASISARIGQKAVLGREAHCQSSFGCSWSEFTQLTGCARIIGARHHPLVARYWYTKNHAQRLHAEWNISLPQFAAIVGNRLHLIARRSDGLVLRRIDPAKPYTTDNVELVTLRENAIKTNGFAKARMSSLARKQLRAREKRELAVQLQRDGHTMQEIAEKIGRSRAAVAQYLMIARQEAELS
jgi:DNA-binding CsgD family transcriptional regulator